MFVPYSSHVNLMGTLLSTAKQCDRQCNGRRGCRDDREVKGEASKPFARIAVMRQGCCAGIEVLLPGVAKIRKSASDRAGLEPLKEREIRANWMRKLLRRRSRDGRVEGSEYWIRW